ncbi:MAG: Holliday junction branch migration protein RuvA [Clostridiales bacterium]|nr:Holliday junction branch migration protein RuvA [Clostridiales bacterium]
MFDYISGKVAAVTENRIVIDCGGVGFSIVATASACAEFGRTTEAKIPVYLAVREDALELYGFSSVRERELFLHLIAVSGVGAKLAITLLSGMSADRLATAIASADTAALSAVKGVGKKTAERIALELRDKIAAKTDISSPAALTSVDERAVLALASLGYEKKEAEAAVKKVAKPDMTTEQIVYAVLHG